MAKTRKLEVRKAKNGYLFSIHSSEASSEFDLEGQDKVGGLSDQ